jgi:hypothetical protein
MEETVILGDWKNAEPANTELADVLLAVERYKRKNAQLKQRLTKKKALILELQAHLAKQTNALTQVYREQIDSLCNASVPATRAELRSYIVRHDND